MKLLLSKIYLIALIAVSLVGLTSCGKDHDLVSDFVVREKKEQIQTSNEAVTTKILAATTLKKKDGPVAPQRN